MIQNDIGRLIRSDGIAGTITRGASGALFANVIGAGLILATQILLTRLMGVYHYGVYVYVFSWLLVLAHVSKCGLDTLLVKEIAVYRNQKIWPNMLGLLRFSHALAGAAAILVGGVTAAAAWFLAPRIGSDLAMCFWIGCLALPPLALSGLRQMGLRAFKRVVLAQLPESIVMPVALMLSTIAAFYLFSAERLTGPFVMTLQLFATTVAFASGVIWLRRALPPELREQPAIYRQRDWIHTAIPLMFISGGAILLQRTSVVLVGILVDTTAAGNFSAAMRLSMLMTFGLTAINSIAAPMIAELYAEGKKEELQKMVTYAAIGLAAFSLPVAAVLIVSGNWLLSWFDPSYKAGYWALVFLALSQLINALTGSVGFLLTMTGFHSHAAKVTGIVAILNIPLSAALIRWYGIAGAGAAMGIAIAALNITNWFIVRKQVGIDPTLLYLFRRSTG